MKMFWKIAVPVTCVALICGAVFAWRGYKERKLTERIRVCRISAEQGDAQAQFKLATLYHRGKGVSQNYSEALRWYRKAADQGNAMGQYGVGFMYELGQGVPQDYAEALLWYRKAADQGYSKAECGLGSMYYNGRGVPQDHQEAARWYRLAADRGLAKAQYDLGYMYYYGQGVPQDRAGADHWFHKAADQGDEDAQRLLGLKGPGLSKIHKINLSIIFLGSLLLSIGYLLPSWRFLGKQYREGAVAGLLGISYAALSVFGAYHFGVRQPGSAVDAFYFAKYFLLAISAAMFISLLLPDRAKPKIAKIALGLFGILFIGFNIFATMHHDLARLTPAIRILCAVNGHLIGLSISPAIYLWRTYRNPEANQNVNSEADLSETPAENGEESDQA
jgi:TPR repeat protein